MKDEDVPHSVWVTSVEFARMMGKSYSWAIQGIHEGLFLGTGIEILCIPRDNWTGLRSGGGKGYFRYYLRAPF